MEQYFNGFENTPFGKLITFIESKVDECLGDLGKWRRYEQIAAFITERKPNTGLGFACYAGSIRLVKILIDQGVDVNEDAGEGLTPLQLLCQKNMFLKDNENLAVLLMESKADINRQNSSGQTALHMACCNNKLDMVKTLIKGGADVNTVDVDGHSPFWECCNRNSLMLTAWLHGQINAQSWRRYASVDICVELVKGGVDPKEGTILPFVVVFTKLQTLQEVLDVGFDVNMKDDKGRTALDFTPQACNGPYEVLKVLIEKGLIFNPRDDELKFELMREAYKQGDIDMLCYFLSFGHVLHAWEMSSIPYPNLSEWARSGKNTIDMDSTLLAWNLLCKAGFPVRVGEITRMIDDVSKTSKLSAASSIMKDALLPFFTLGDLCRVIIRLRLRHPINCHVDRLTLPANLKSFLKFEDFKLQAKCIKLAEVSIS